MASIKDIQEEIIEEFSFYDDWTEKYEYIIELGKDLAPMNELNRTDDNIIKGCQSKVWIACSQQEDQLVFEADSDAIIVKGLIALLVRVYNQKSIKAILEEPLYFIDKIGMANHLSPTRSNGLLAMVKQIKFYAVAFQAKLNED
jgi:cysteine desulfuration protein SufE